MANRENKRSGQKSGSDGNRSSLKAQFSEHRTYTISDLRLEKPSFTIRQILKGDEICYEVEGNLNTSVPPIRESKYLSKQQHIEIYRWMLLNRKMEQALENLYKQGKSLEAFTSDSARKPARVPRLSLFIKTNGLDR